MNGPEMLRTWKVRTTATGVVVTLNGHEFELGASAASIAFDLGFSSGAPVSGDAGETRADAIKIQSDIYAMARNLAGAITVDPTTFRHVGVELGEEDETILGSVYIFGVLHHCMFVRVRVTEDGVQTGHTDPHERYADVTRSCQNGPAQTIKLPGLPGEWVCVIEPSE